MDKVRVLSSFDDVTVTPAFTPYTRIIVIVNDDLSYTAGDSTGRTMTVECPWGTQQIADNLLRQYQGFRYQPFDATGLVMDQAAELGDGIQVGRAVYSGLYDQNIEFSSLPKSSASAPQSEEIDHEFPFKPAIDRKYTRQYHETKATLKVQAGLISAEVTARTEADAELSSALKVQADAITAEVTARKEAVEAESEARKGDVKTLNAALTVQAGLISQKVSQTGGSTDKSFEYEMVPDHVSYSADGSEVLRIDKTGLDITGRVKATAGLIGGFTIEDGYMHTGTGSFAFCDIGEMYWGPEGINISNEFIVDAYGNMQANTGTFKGSVQAGNISYGGSDGYFNGGGIETSTVTATEIADSTITATQIEGSTITAAEIAGSTIGTAELDYGVNSSLGYADFSDDVFNNRDTAPYVSTDAVYANDIVVEGTLHLSNWTVKRKSFLFNGDMIQYLAWE